MSVEEPRPHHEVHLDKVDGETLAQYKRVIVSARDPVDRVVSAFNWRASTRRKRKGECTQPFEKFDAAGALQLFSGRAAFC